MFDLIIKNALTIDGYTTSIAAKNNSITYIGNNLNPNWKSTHIIDLQKKYYISSGWIDSHVHVFEKSPIYYDNPDIVGVLQGVTTVIDAGSVGVLDLPEFYSLTQQSHTNVFALLNISKIGLIRQNELADLQDLDENIFLQACNKYQDFIIGMKARISKSVVEGNGVEPLKIAKTWQSKLTRSMPLMVHVGNAPPDIEHILEHLEAGDILTHCFNGKPNQIFQDDKLKACVINAINKGVLLDVGHGAESFDIRVATKAKQTQIDRFTISSDLYSKNRLNGTVHSLANVMNKFLNLGFTIQEIINKVTKEPAENFNLKNKGQLEMGFDADFTIFELDKKITPAAAYTKQKFIQLKH